MPDAECPSLQPTAYSYSYDPEEHVCWAAEKRLHDEVGGNGLQGKECGV